MSWFNSHDVDSIISNFQSTVEKLNTAVAHHSEQVSAHTQAVYEHSRQQAKAESIAKKLSELIA